MENLDTKKFGKPLVSSYTKSINLGIRAINKDFEDDSVKFNKNYVGGAVVVNVVLKFNIKFLDDWDFFYYYILKNGAEYFKIDNKIYKVIENPKTTIQANLVSVSFKAEVH